MIKKISYNFVRELSDLIDKGRLDFEVCLF